MQIGVINSHVESGTRDKVPHHLNYEFGPLINVSPLGSQGIFREDKSVMSGMSERDISYIEREEETLLRNRNSSNPAHAALTVHC